MNLSKNVQIRTALDHAEGSADRNGATYDTQGFEGVLPCCSLSSRFSHGGHALHASHTTTRAGLAAASSHAVTDMTDPMTRGGALAVGVRVHRKCGSA